MSRILDEEEIREGVSNPACTSPVWSDPQQAHMDTALRVAALQDMKTGRAKQEQAEGVLNVAVQSLLDWIRNRKQVVNAEGGVGQRNVDYTMGILSAYTEIEQHIGGAL